MCVGGRQPVLRPVQATAAAHLWHHCAMSIEIRFCPPDRWLDFLLVAEYVFGETVTPEFAERYRRTCDLERFPAVFEDGRIVATSGVLTFNLTVPGGEIPAGGVTVVGVLPSHRRRGLMSTLMRRMIDDCHARGEPVAILWASEGKIYQRFGYGLANMTMNLAAEKPHTAYTRQWERQGSFRLLRQDEAREVVAPIYEAARGQRAGFLARPPEWWPGIVQDDDKEKKGGEAKRIVVYETDDGPEAYAVYKVKADWDERGANGTVLVTEAIATTPRGTRQIWRYLFDVDLWRTLKAIYLPIDHPVFSLVAEPRRLGATLGDGLWLRIVVLPLALEGRTYGLDGHGQGRLTFDLRDDFCPWNAGRWTLDVTDGRARVTRSEGEADLALDANDLGALYLGGFTASALASAGRIVELKSGGLATADRLFPTALAPWCPQEF
jgi:predicted acetyltransferase